MPIWNYVSKRMAEMYEIYYRLFSCNNMFASLEAIFNIKISKKFLMVNKHSGWIMELIYSGVTAIPYCKFQHHQLLLKMIRENRFFSKFYLINFVWESFLQLLKDLKLLLKLLNWQVFLSVQFTEDCNSFRSIRCWKLLVD